MLTQAELDAIKERMTALDSTPGEAVEVVPDLLDTIEELRADARLGASVRAIAPFCTTMLTDWKALHDIAALAGDAILVAILRDAIDALEAEDADK